MADTMCEVCGQNPASTFLTLVVNGQVKEMHLCDACAARKGLDGKQPVSISDVLLGLGSPAAAAGPPVQKTCPRCQMRFEDFKKASRLGCPECYEAFAAELEPLLESMHRAGRHVGKQPARCGGPAVSQLQARLAAAVQAENFEEAARLRDQIAAAARPAAPPTPP